jgi:hypothetical protein
MMMMSFVETAILEVSSAQNQFSRFMPPSALQIDTGKPL